MFHRPQVLIFGAIGTVVAIAFLMVTGVLPGLRDRTPPPFTLTVWGFDHPEVWRAIEQRYRQEAVESATIAYVPKDERSYEGELLDALAGGGGPDMFILKDAWLVKHRGKIRPLEEGALGYRERDLKTVFADGVTPSLTGEQGSLLGTPLAFDTLALFFNRDHFNSANIPAPPRTWEELLDANQKLTVLSPVGGIVRSGIALGTASNIDHAAEIVAALILQSGGELIDAGGKRSLINRPETATALAFYTTFANSTNRAYSWNAFFERSLRAFARGETAIAIGYAADVPGVAALNPQLNFDVAPLPQRGGLRTAVNFGRFSVLAVSRTSTQNEQAWRFLLWLQSKEAHKFYVDALGLPPARRDLVTTKPPRDYLTPFYDQVLSARILPAGAGDSLTGILDDMIEAVINRRLNITQAVARADQQLNQALSR